MAKDECSDDELVEADRRAYRTRIRWIGWSALYGTALGVLLIFAVRSGIVSLAWIAQAPLTHIMLLSLPFVLPIMLAAALTPRVPKAARAPRIQRKLIEDHQRRRRSSLFIFLIVLPYSAALQTWQIAAHPYVFSDQWILAGLFALLVALCLVVLLIEPKNADEITSSIRAKAAKLGFVTAAGMFMALYLAVMARAAWVRPAIPGAIAVILLVPMIYFLIADWRAGREQ